MPDGLKVWTASISGPVSSARATIAFPLRIIDSGRPRSLIGLKEEAAIWCPSSEFFGQKVAWLEGGSGAAGWSF